MSYEHCTALIPAYLLEHMYMNHKIYNKLEKKIDDSDLENMYMNKNLSLSGSTYRKLHNILQVLKLQAVILARTMAELERLQKSSMCKNCYEGLSPMVINSLDAMQHNVRISLDWYAHIVERFEKEFGITP